MNKKRTRLEVIRDMLDVLKKGRQVKITHLIYKANLSSNGIKPYLDELIKNQLAEQVTEKDKRYYKISRKGIEFLEEFNKIKIFSEAYGL